MKLIHCPCGCEPHAQRRNGKIQMQCSGCGQVSAPVPVADGMAAAWSAWNALMESQLALRPL